MTWGTVFLGFWVFVSIVEVNNSSLIRGVIYIHEYRTVEPSINFFYVYVLSSKTVQLVYGDTKGTFTFYGLSLRHSSDSVVTLRPLTPLPSTYTMGVKQTKIRSVTTVTVRIMVVVQSSKHGTIEKQNVESLKRSLYFTVNLMSITVESSLINYGFLHLELVPFPTNYFLNLKGKKPLSVHSL